MKSSKISPLIKKNNLLIIINLILIGVALCFINYSDFDAELQNYFFDFKNKSWLIDKNEPVKKFIFYKFPKIIFAAAIFVCLIASVKLPHNRHTLILILLGLIIIPLLAGNIKKFTNIYCPEQLEIYGGDKPYVKIFNSYPENFHQLKKGECFPAGHCITGFALMILFFALQKKSHRILGLLTSLTLGWITGFYQMLKGAHFFGDTLVSMLVCFFLAALIARFYSKFSSA